MVRPPAEGRPLNVPGQPAVLRGADKPALEGAIADWLSATEALRGPTGAAAYPGGDGDGPNVAVLVAGAGGDEGNVPEQAVVDLLGGPLGIGAVVPLVHDQHGRVVEAGTFAAPSGSVAPFGAGASVAAPDHAFRRDIPGSSSPVVAVSDRALAGYRPDEAGGQAAGALGDVLNHVRAQGLRIVYEPSWHVLAADGVVPGPGRSGRGGGPSAMRPARRGCWWLPGRSRARGWVPKASAIWSRRWPGAPRPRVTLACADGFGASRYGGYFQRQGIEVVAGPMDWLAWCGDRRYHYSHVVVSDEGLTTRLWPMARSTQPQAMAVLYSEQLPFRRGQALGDASWHTDGTETVTELWQGRLLRQVDGLDAAWCASTADANLLGGLGGPLKVFTIGPPLSRPGMAKGFADREGVVLVATDGFDVSSDAEEPALRALDQLVPAWRRRDMSLAVRVVSDWPTPGLAHAAAELGAEVIPSGGDLVDVLGTARLIVAPIKHGVERAVLGARRHGRGHALAVHGEGCERHFPGGPGPGRDRPRHCHHGAERLVAADRRGDLERTSPAPSAPSRPT